LHIENYRFKNKLIKVIKICEGMSYRKIRSKVFTMNIKKKKVD